MALGANGRPSGESRRPLVGITGGSYDLPIEEGTLPSYGVDRCNPRAVVQAGGDPVLVVAVDEADESAPERYADMLDAFVFAGGVDIAPSTYGQPDPPAGHGRFTSRCATGSRSRSSTRSEAAASRSSASAAAWSS